jgi:hypothetical protein
MHAMQYDAVIGSNIVEAAPAPPRRFFSLNVSASHQRMLKLPAGGLRITQMGYACWSALLLGAPNVRNAPRADVECHDDPLFSPK